MNTTADSGSPSLARRIGPFVVAFIVLAVLLGALFHKSFETNMVAFSNDGPLGVQNSDAFSAPAVFKGIWLDLYWIGNSIGYAYASITWLVKWMFGPVGFAKYYEPVSLLFLGVCAWPFFRSLKLSPALCTVGAIAAALNGNFFSNTCWGLGSRALTLAFAFLALAALNAKRQGNPWLNAALAGLAVGMAVVEGADNGVFFSLFVAAYVVYQSFVEEKSVQKRVKKSLRLVLVTGFALFMATQSLVGLFGLAEKGSVSAKANAAEREANWTFATQWSLPPAETLRVIIPGLYGYRMDAPHGDFGSVYWGRVGESPQAPPGQGGRFNGSGEYAGLLVVLLAFWAVAASFSKSVGIYSPVERKFIWFWGVAAVVALVLAWGRFAPFYRFIYALPYFSSIRNPMKLMHVTHLALLILFGYGLLGLSRRYLEKSAQVEPAGNKSKSWWKAAPAFERRIVWAAGALLAVSALGFLIYGSSRTDLENHLMQIGFGQPAFAEMIARFSIHQVGWYLLFLLLSLAALFAVMRGYFAGQRKIWAAILLGTVLTVDLVRADTPWIVYWNLKYKYATNPIVDILRKKPYEGRVGGPLIDKHALSAMGGYTFKFPELFGIEWNQHHFPYYNIQSMSVAQEPRPPADKGAYMRAVTNLDRYWELTNTRYILGMTGFLNALNSSLDQGRNRFRIVATFDVVPKPGVDPNNPRTTSADYTVTIVTNGPLALFEFTGALPRAKLYSQWRVMTNDDEVLRTLGDPAFDPAATVLVDDEIPAPAPEASDHGSNSVEFVSYSSRRIEFRADAVTPSVLLLNDHYHPAWYVTLDGEPVKMLRCNFIMRGVQVPVGQHTIVFQFKPSLIGLKISLVAIGIGAVLCVLLLFVRQPEPAPTPAPSRPKNRSGK